MKIHRALLGLVATIQLSAGTALAHVLPYIALVGALRQQGFQPEAQERHFDEWAFGGVAGARRFRVRLENLLRNKIDEVEQMFVLTAAQRDKLRLAGHGDIKRLLDAIEDARREFDKAKHDIDRLREVQKDLRSVDLRVSSGPFELGSLFHKTLLKMFDEKQLKRKSPGVKGSPERAGCAILAKKLRKTLDEQEPSRSRPATTDR